MTNNLKTGRKKCKTCNSPYLQEIEEMYLGGGNSARAVSDYLKSQYGFSITPQALLNHFRLCLNKGRSKEKNDKKIKELREKILEKDTDLIDALHESILFKLELAKKYDLELLTNDHAIGQRKSYVVKTINNELREFIKLKADLTIGKRR